MLFFPFRNEFLIEAFCVGWALLRAAGNAGDHARFNPTPAANPALTTYRS
jgi:hypothetical protein